LNYNIYNLIYQEILQNNEELTIYELISKYSLSEKDLRFVLFQIQKNEYLSNNSVLLKLITEINSNEIPLDIYNIISSKEEENSSMHEPEKNNEIKKSAISENINKKYLIALTLILVIGIIIFFSLLRKNSVVENNMQQSNKESSIITKTNEKTTIIELENSLPIEEVTIDKAEEKEIEPIIDNIEKEIEEIIISENKQEHNENKENTSTIPTLTTPIDIEQLDYYQKDIKFLDNKVFYDGNYYEEGDYLFGFKIFKITSSYVRFEDEKKNIRKRLLFSNLEEGKE